MEVAYWKNGRVMWCFKRENGLMSSRVYDRTGRRIYYHQYDHAGDLTYFVQYHRGHEYEEFNSEGLPPWDFNKIWPPKPLDLEELESN